MVNKLCELQYILYEVQPYILFVTESWLNENVPTGCLDPNPCYHVMRCDRKTGRGGGVCIFVHRSLQPDQVDVNDTYKELELLCFDLICNTRKLRFFCAYRPPCNDSSGQVYLDLLLKCITAYTGKCCTSVILGDFNLPNIDWNTYSCINNYVNSAMLTFVIELGFCQFVNFATRGCNLLDIVLANDPLIVSSVEAAPPLGNSDHNTVKFVLNMDSNCANHDSMDTTTEEYNWYKADFNGMSNYLNTVDWHGMLYSNPSGLSFWSSIVDTLWSAVSMFVPLRKVSHRLTKRNHYPKPIRRLITKKHRLWKWWKCCPADGNAYQMYCDCAAVV